MQKKTNRAVTVLIFMIVIFLISACGDSGHQQTEPDGDFPTNGDVPTCTVGEACLIPADESAPAVCGDACSVDADCIDSGGCCIFVSAEAGSGYCMPELYCDYRGAFNHCCLTDPECIALGYDICLDQICQMRPNTDGDGADGDFIDGDKPDGDEEVIQYDCESLSPVLSFSYDREEQTGGVDFGAVPMATKTERTVTISNEGPTGKACFQYELDAATSGEFTFKEGSELAEGEWVCIPVGGQHSITVTYFPIDAGVDSGWLNILQSKTTPDGNALVCREDIALVSLEKGEVHPFTDPQEPGPLDCGDVRVGDSKTLNLIIGNAYFDATTNKTLRAYDFRLEVETDLNFRIPPNQFENNQVALAPGETAELKITCIPINEREHFNKLIFNTNDTHHPEYKIDLANNGVVPKACVEPFPVIFGDVALGETGYKRMEICSCGGYELNVFDMQITEDDTFSFSYDLLGNIIPTTLPAEGEGQPGADCFEIEVACYPNERGLVQSYLEIESDATGNTLFMVPLSCNGVGPNICTYPSSPISFGAVQYDENFPAVVPPKLVQIWNCGPGEAVVEGVTIAMGLDTPADTFTLQNFLTHEPTEGNPYPLIGGDNPNELTFEVVYNPPGYGEHTALIHVDAESAGFNLGTFLEVIGIATDCEENYWDLDPGIPGCEYYCVYDEDNPYDEPSPDDGFKDNNCDGIDGMIEDAVFVAPDGNDDSLTGTPDAPKKTINSAIFLAASQGKPHVYVSVGTYPKKLTLSSGISIYGGYNRHMVDSNSPIGWGRSMDYIVTISSSENIGINASFIGEPTRLQMLSVQAYGTSQDDVSSYGIYSRKADALVLEYIDIAVGDGRNGQPGFSDGERGRDANDGENGQSGREDDGSWYCSGQGKPGIGLGGNSVCSSRGGSGGYSCKTSSSSGCSGFCGEQGSAGACSGCGNQGGSGSSGCDGDNGYAGSHGSGGSNEGTIANNKWVPNPGQQGSPGGTGGGGGGGGGGGSRGGGIFNCDDYGGTGGGGGGGGCGGGGGAGGEGAGSSIGIFLYESSLELHHITITTGDGGTGGSGRGGGVAGRGGDGGEGGADYQGGYPGGYGGDGGNGGRGGSGGGGQGGNSIGLFSANNSVPLIDDIDITLGDSGMGGGPGTSQGNDGEDGFTEEIYTP